MFVFQRLFFRFSKAVFAALRGAILNNFLTSAREIFHILYKSLKIGDMFCLKAL